MRKPEDQSQYLCQGNPDTPTKQEKNPNLVTMRKPKLNINFLRAAHDVINDKGKNNALILNDYELLILINKKLERKERICNDTYYNWKTTIKEHGVEALSPIAREFYRMIKEAEVAQKQGLFARMSNDGFGWQRFAWLLERKYDDWNLKAKTESKSVVINTDIASIQKMSEAEVDRALAAIDTTARVVELTANTIEETRKTTEAVLSTAPSERRKAIGFFIGKDAESIEHDGGDIDPGLEAELENGELEQFNTEIDGSEQAAKPHQSSWAAAADTLKPDA